MTVQTPMSDAKIVEDALKTMAEPIRLKDLVELTKDRVKWRTKSNHTAQIKKMMKEVPTIVNVGFGLYEYLPNGKNVEVKSDKVKKDKSKPKRSENINSRKDDEVLEVTDKDKELLENFRKDTKPMTFTKKKTYKVGDEVEGRVTGVEDYGAFIENEDGDMQGLIHITNISKSVTDDVLRHFAIGDVVKAKVVSVRSGGKLSLSTKDYPLPDYFRNEEMESKLKPVADKVRSGKFTSPAPQKFEQENDEHKEVYKFIQGITGVVSDRAREKIKELIEKDGMFKFTMALTEAQRGFEVDVSMMLANEIEKKLSDGL